MIVGKAKVTLLANDTLLGQREQSTTCLHTAVSLGDSDLPSKPAFSSLPPFVLGTHHPHCRLSTTYSAWSCSETRTCTRAPAIRPADSVVLVFFVSVTDLVTLTACQSIDNTMTSELGWRQDKPLRHRGEPPVSVSLREWLVVVPVIRQRLERASADVQLTHITRVTCPRVMHARAVTLRDRPQAQRDWPGQTGFFFFSDPYWPWKFFFLVHTSTL